MTGPRARPWLALGLLGLLAAAVLLDAWLSVGWVLDTPVMVLGCLVAGYAAGAWLAPLAAAGAASVTAVALTVANQHHEPGAYPVADDLVFFLLVVGAPAVAGATLTRRRRELAELSSLRSRLEERRTADLRAARLEEQQRVEVDCHRRLAEQLGGVVLLAEGARHEPSQEAVTRALAQVEDTAREALAELRQVVGTLRLPADASAAPLREDDQPLPRPGPEAADVLLAVAVGGAIAAECAVRDVGPGPVWGDALAALLVAAPLVWRRRHPLPALGASLLLATAMTAVLTPLTVTVTALSLLLVTAYAAGAYVRPWPLGLALTWGGDVALAWAGQELADLTAIIATAVLSGLLFLAGRAAAAAADRARRMRGMLAELERGRDAEVREAVAGTRLELARELHDTVAYSMTVTCVQATAAQGRDGDPARAIDAILGAAREGMAELRAGLDEIESSDAPLDQRSLSRLAERAGLEVSWSVEQAALPTGRAAALLRRVLREAFTNAARHAPGAPVLVRLTRRGDALEVEVVDEGSAEAARGGGTASGLAGLADAVTSAGGSLTSGPRPAGGFRVAASLPLDVRVPA